MSIIHSFRCRRRSVRLVDAPTEAQQSAVVSYTNFFLFLIRSRRGGPQRTKATHHVCVFSTEEITYCVPVEKYSSTVYVENNHFYTLILS